MANALGSGGLLGPWGHEPKHGTVDARYGPPRSDLAPPASRLPRAGLVPRPHTGEGRDVYDEQLRRWRTGPLTSAQQREVVRLEGANREWRAVLTDILALADELETGTIERQLSKSDLQLGIEYVLRGDQPR